MSRAMTAAEITLPQLEADRIICFEMKLSRASLLTRPEAEVPPEIFERLAEMGRRRASGEPLAYILNDAMFRGRNFFVDGRVLIPRPETETLVEIAGEYLTDNPRGAFADWCAGSGCVAATLLAENPNCSGYAVDVSPGALKVAAINARRHSVDDRLTLIENGDPARVTEIPDESLDLVVANPPYIPSGEVAELERQVREFEPSLALDGGADGLDVFKILLAGLPRLMKPGASLLFETGGGKQPGELISWTPRGLSPEKIFRDHRDIERFVMWRRTRESLDS